MTTFAFDNSGQLKAPTDQELAQADEDSAILVYISGTVEDGRPYYAYLAIKPSRYQAFQDKSTAGEHIVPDDYGTAIASEFKPAPSPGVISAMRDMYGFDEYYLDKLRHQVISAHKIFLSNRETQRIDDIVTMMKKKTTE